MDGIVGHQMEHPAALEIEGQEIDFLGRQQVTQTGRRPRRVLQTKGQLGSNRHAREDNAARAGEPSRLR